MIIEYTPYLVMRPLLKSLDGLNLSESVRRSKKGRADPLGPCFPNVQTCYQSAIMDVSMSKQLEIPDESQEVGHPPSRFLLPGSTFNAPVTIYTNYGQHASGGGRIDNYYGGT
jgi:hypothetical protein